MCVSLFPFWYQRLQLGEKHTSSLEGLLSLDCLSCICHDLLIARQASFLYFCWRLKSPVVFLMPGIVCNNFGIMCDSLKENVKRFEAVICVIA